MPDSTLYDQAYNIQEKSDHLESLLRETTLLRNPPPNQDMSSQQLNDVLLNITGKAVIANKPDIAALHWKKYPDAMKAVLSDPDHADELTNIIEMAQIYGQTNFLDELKELLTDTTPAPVKSQLCDVYTRGSFASRALSL